MVAHLVAQVERTSLIDPVWSQEQHAFVKEVHNGNFARASSAKLLIGSSVVLGLKSIQFELNDRDACDALPSATVRNALEANQVSSMRKFRRKAIISQASRREASLPDMKVPKLTDQAFDDWNTSFTTVVGRQNSLAGISLDYLLRESEVGNYNANWPTREEKLKYCIKLHGSSYKSDTESLHSLLVEHIGTVGYGSNLVIKHRLSASRKEGDVILSLSLIFTMKHTNKI